jgi:mono/diheme cytochrome c family protein
MKPPAKGLRVTLTALALGGACLPAARPAHDGTDRPPGELPAYHGDRGPLVMVEPVAPVERIHRPGPLPAPAPLSPGEVGFAPGISAKVAPPPLAGGTLLALRDAHTAVVSDPEGDRIWVVDVIGERVVAQIPLSPGDEPGRLVEDGAGRVHVALRRGGALVSFTPGTEAAVVERRGICPAPRGLAYQAATQQVHVACAGGELVSLPAGGGPATRTLRLEDDLRDVVVDGARLLVTRFRRAELLVLDAEGKLEERVRPAEALNLTRRQLVSRPARTRFVPSVAWRAVARPGGGVYLAHQRAFTGEIGGSGYGGGGCDPIVQSVVSQVMPGSPTPAADDAPPSLVGAVLPVDLALSPDGSRLALLAAGEPRRFGETALVLSGPATVFSVSNPTVPCMHVGAEFADTADPAADLWAPEADGVVRTSRIGGQGMAIAFDGRGEVLVQTRAPATLRVPRLGKVITLGAEGERDTGYTVFHAAARGQVACASCHPEGTEDGQVWNFVGLGPRRTQFLPVGLSQTAPFHWDGTLTTLDELMRDVFSVRMNGGPLDFQQVTALGSWLDRLSPPPARRPAGDLPAARGKALFDSAAVGCAVCHGGPRLTDNLSHDVGTGALLQTPSLVGISWRSPFMHDGCAPTLMGRFAGTCGGGDRHGLTSPLTEPQLLDLVAYLESL